MPASEAPRPGPGSRLASRGGWLPAVLTVLAVVVGLTGAATLRMAKSSEQRRCARLASGQARRGAVPIRPAT